jgi:hypothetical protein
MKIQTEPSFSLFSSARPDFRSTLNYQPSTAASPARTYCRKLVADGLGQRRVSVVTLAAFPPARSIQQSPRVEQ